jgi:hypothetical protein
MIRLLNKPKCKIIRPVLFLGKDIPVGWYVRTDYSSSRLFRIIDEPKHWMAELSNDGLTVIHAAGYSDTANSVEREFWAAPCIFSEEHISK